MGTIIVTGGAGYIGSHTLIELLTRTNFKVISLDNYSNSSSETYERVKKITGKDVSSHDINLCDRETLFSILSKISDIKGIIHFAAFKSVPDSMTDPLSYYHNNLTSLNNLLQYCRENKINNFIFSSSC